VSSPSLIAIIGLGYVGLPLAVEFGKHGAVIGFDIDEKRISELCAGVDATLEVESEELSAAKHLTFTSNLEELRSANTFIITVPTPIDEYKRPDLTPLIKASETIGKVLKSGDIVIYESTVYPGATEEDCVPVLEDISGLTFNEDFFVGYSPERINPGDRAHRLPSIRKVTAGSTPEVAAQVTALYDKIITAGTFQAQSIRVAEAAKVIENTQRDLNIALINELAMIFNRMGLDTEAVLEAAETKWNFLSFRPGLVGGHCIGVDPYYLTHKAEAIGYHAEVILAGRRINDGMGAYAAQQLVKLMLAELETYGVNVDVYDPWVDRVEARTEYGIDLVEKPENRSYDGILLAVAHDEFIDSGAGKIRDWGKADHVLYDLKSIFPLGDSDLRL